MQGNKDIGASGNIVMQVASVIPKKQDHILYVDNWFTSVNMQVGLEKIGIHSLGTVHGNRLRVCVFCSEKELKVNGCGTFEEKTSVVDNISYVQQSGWTTVLLHFLQHLYLLILHSKLSAMTENINLLYKSDAHLLCLIITPVWEVSSRFIIDKIPYSDQKQKMVFRLFIHSLDVMLVIVS